MTTTEDYVSFEIAKLLNEKGFDGECNYYYPEDGGEMQQLLLDELYYHNEDFIKCPTHQMAIKWLREVYKLHIAILWDSGACIGKNSFYYHIDRVDNYEDKGYNKIGFDFYEEAVEAALKYSLENLI